MWRTLCKQNGDGHAKALVIAAISLRQTDGARFASDDGGGGHRTGVAFAEQFPHECKNFISPDRWRQSLCLMEFCAEKGHFLLMAENISVINNMGKEFTFLWIIENYSYTWHDKGKELTSPDFSPDGLEGTSWRLLLCPRGGKEVDSNFSVYLERSGYDAGPDNFSLIFLIGVFTADGLNHHVSKINTAFDMGSIKGWSMCMDFEQFMRKVYSLYDSLYVYCTMWKDETEIRGTGQFTARTCIAIERISFLHKVESFNDLELNQKKTLQIQCHSNTGCLINSNLYVTKDSNDKGMIIIENIPSDSNCILRTQKVSLLDASGNAVECGDIDNRFDATLRDIGKLPLTLSKQIIIERKSDCLPNGELSLLCECTFSTGIELKKIEETHHYIPTTADVKRCCRKGSNIVAEKLHACSSALDDLTTFYNCQLFTDVELKIGKKSFPAHRFVLCARSPVFKAMLTKKKKKKRADCIQVNDMDDDTMQKFLHFMYSDKLGSLDLESAFRLYWAANEYEVEKLKLLCSSILIDYLSATTASDLLLLGDVCKDSGLKEAAENYILEHEEEVFGTDEWETLIDEHPKLVIKIMYLKYKKKKAGK
ncbi:Speckle-type POZ protein like [Argiope bruennichi]|uniref:Speckle-type POZ protein like n=1 Tax=Argiope bruennichi TaxID=94029 RepID=A0A8T0EPJ6_ARGBR|nr:Speckle-type POZ protein like [Argiope bruennichi]